MDRRLLVLALGMFALGTDSFVVAGVLPEISRFFGVSISAAGQMTTVYAITYRCWRQQSPRSLQVFRASRCWWRASRCSSLPI
jgi:type IV secretory pathway TrbL component